MAYNGPELPYVQGAPSRICGGKLKNSPEGVGWLAQGGLGALATQKVDIVLPICTDVAPFGVVVAVSTSGVEEDPPEQSACDSGLSMCSVNIALGTIPTFEPASSWIGSTVSTPTVGRFFMCSVEERVLFIGTQFSNLYTAVDTPARGRVGCCRREFRLQKVSPLGWRRGPEDVALAIPEAILQRPPTCHCLCSVAPANSSANIKRSRHRPLQEQNNQRGSRLGSLYYDNITTLTTCPRRSR